MELLFRILLIMQLLLSLSVGLSIFRVPCLMHGTFFLYKVGTFILLFSYLFMIFIIFYNFFSPLLRELLKNNLTLKIMSIIKFKYGTLLTKRFKSFHLLPTIHFYISYQNGDRFICLEFKLLCFAIGFAITQPINYNEYLKHINAD